MEDIVLMIVVQLFIFVNVFLIHLILLNEKITIIKDIENMFFKIKTLCVGWFTDQTKLNECCVCLETIESDSNHAISSCKHVFHTNCLLSLTEKICPLCRCRWEVKKTMGQIHERRISPIAARARETREERSRGHLF